MSIGHTFTKEDEKKFEPLPEGDYELVIENIEKKTFIEKTGPYSGKNNIFLKITYKVRDDQVPALPYAGRKVFASIMPTYDNQSKCFSQHITQEDGEWVDFNKLSQLLKTQSTRDGYKTDFPNGIDEYILFMTGRVLIGHVTQRDNEYNGEITIQNNVTYWKTSTLGSYVEKKEEQTIYANKENVVPKNELDDDDLPF